MIPGVLNVLFAFSTVFYGYFYRLLHLTRGQRPSYRVQVLKVSLNCLLFFRDVFGIPGNIDSNIFLRYLSEVPNTGTH